MSIAIAGPDVITPEGYQRLTAELDQLKTVSRREVADALRHAREDGGQPGENTVGGGCARRRRSARAPHRGAERRACSEPDRGSAPGRRHRHRAARQGPPRAGRNADELSARRAPPSSIRPPAGSRSSHLSDRRWWADGLVTTWRSKRRAGTARSRSSMSVHMRSRAGHTRTVQREIAVPLAPPSRNGARTPSRTASVWRIIVGDDPSRRAR